MITALIMKVRDVGAPKEAAVPVAAATPAAVTPVAEPAPEFMKTVKMVVPPKDPPADFLTTQKLDFATTQKLDLGNLQKP
jgi:hypothetical protein